MRDVFGVEIEVGNIVVKGCRPGSSGPYLEVREVLEVEDGRIKSRVIQSKFDHDTKKKPAWSTKSHNLAVVIP